MPMAIAVRPDLRQRLQWHLSANDVQLGNPPAATTG